MFALASVLAGCAVRDHADGGGYTVRYTSARYLDDDPPPPPPRRVVRRIRVVEAPPPPVVIVREHRESHPVLNLGKDDEIPHEFARYVSDRSVRSWRQRSKMCRQARPGYCSVPNVAHCHGAFCHAHPGGNRRHTH